MASAGHSESSMITALLQGHWYDAVGVLLSETQDYVQARKLAAAARRVLELDAEDFTAISQTSTPRGRPGSPRPRSRPSRGTRSAGRWLRWSRCMS